jgi:putative ABC transport system permease protein
MNFFSYFRLALLAISRNRMRSFLTTLGILIGVAAVITMIAIGQGSQQKVQSLIENLGTNAIFILPGTSTQGGVRVYSAITSLTVGDAKAIKKDCPAVSLVSPQDQTTALCAYGNQNWTTIIEGVGADYFSIRNEKLAVGRAFTSDEARTGALVCDIGQTVATNLFGDENPVGQTIRIKETPFRVIGVLAPKGENLFGQDQDDVILAPYATVMHRLTGNTHLHMILAGAVSKNAVNQAQEQITTLLRQRHHLAPWQQDDFMIRNPGEMLRTLDETAKVMELLLGAAAGISLLVGGIGIMNIMLVSVTERTHEIGIRMAVGAAEADVLLQFLIEAFVLSVMGGLFGLLLGSLGSYFVAKAMEVPWQISPNSVILAFGFSALVGIFFGYYPARKASLLDPIEALRYQ